MKFRKKPIVIEAIKASILPKYAGEPPSHEFIDCTWIHKALKSRVLVCTEFRSGHFASWGIQTLEGLMDIGNDDWIIRGVNGELYPCKPDIFEKSYEPEAVIEKGRIPIKEFVDFGYLHELNRQFLHPLGIALMLNVPDNDEPDTTKTTAGFIDARSDPEGYVFGDDMIDRAKIHQVKREKERMALSRQEVLGFVIQEAHHTLPKENA